MVNNFYHTFTYDLSSHIEMEEANCSESQCKKNQVLAPVPVKVLFYREVKTHGTH